MVEVASNKCPACSAKTRAHAVFCHHCGRPLPQQIAVAAQTAQVQNSAVETDIDEQTFVEPTVVEKTFVEQIFVEPKKIESPVAPPAATSDNGKDNGTIATVRESLDSIVRAETVTAKVEPDAHANDLPQKPAPEIGETPFAPTTKRKTKRYVSETEYIWEADEAPAWRILLFALLALVAVAILIWISSTLK